MHCLWTLPEDDADFSGRWRAIKTEYAKRFASGSPVVCQQAALSNVIAIPGGLPIMVGSKIIGGAAA
jgi:uncharacterized protein GlcG (DUF336 family)